MDAVEVYRDLGSHGAQIDQLNAEVMALRRDVAEMKAILEHSKGSVKTLIAVASLSGAIGAGFVKTLAFLKGAP